MYYVVYVRVYEYTLLVYTHTHTHTREFIIYTLLYWYINPQVCVSLNVYAYVDQERHCRSRRDRITKFY